MNRYLPITYIYAREIRCMEVQTDYILMPPEENDLIVGIRTEAPIGFTPQGTGDRMGYYCDAKELSGMLQDETLTEEEKNTVRELLAFWQGRTTQEKTYARYNEALKRDLEHGAHSQSIHITRIFGGLESGHLAFQ